MLRSVIQSLLDQNVLLTGECFRSSAIVGGSQDCAELKILRIQRLLSILHLSNGYITLTCNEAYAVRIREKCNSLSHNFRTSFISLTPISFIDSLLRMDFVMSMSEVALIGR